MLVLVIHRRLVNSKPKNGHLNAIAEGEKVRKLFHHLRGCLRKE